MEETLSIMHEFTTTLHIAKSCADDRWLSVFSTTSLAQSNGDDLHPVQNVSFISQRVPVSLYLSHGEEMGTDR
jgi:hypothetical protein